jgi:hypothetical protein
MAVNQEVMPVKQEHTVARPRLNSRLNPVSSLTEARLTKKIYRNWCLLRVR